MLIDRSTLRTGYALLDTVGWLKEMSRSSLKHLERSFGSMKQKSNEDLANEYLMLEDSFNELTQKIKTTRNKEAQRRMRAKKKELRTRQGLIFKELRGTGYISEIQERLGLGKKGKALARRAKRKDL